MTDDERKPGAGWDVVEDLLAEEEIERRMAMPAAERRAEMKAQGLDPDRAHVVANEVLAKLGYPTAATAPTAEPPKVVSLDAARDRRRPKRPAWVLALVAAAIALVVVGGGGAIVALNTPSPSATSPAPSIPTAPPGPSPEQLAQEQRAKADELRKLAAVDCAAEKWRACSKDLDQAAALDPQGDDARRVQRLRGKADRGLIAEGVEVKAAPGPRSLRPEAKARLLAALAPSSAQPLRLACAPGAEPSHLCDQLVAALTSAGWTVTRVPLATDAGAPHGVLVEVATDADDATQTAADALARALEKAFLPARGPDDAPPGAALRLTIGPQ
jgi:hypothetical protein